MSRLSCVIFVGLFCSIYAGPIVLSPEDDDVIALPDFGPRSYVAPSNKTGDLVANWNPSMKVKPEELGEYLEGDMMLPPSMTRGGWVAKTYRWQFGIVPYVITGNFTAAQRALIMKAMNEFNTKTCIKFVPRFFQTDYIRITSANTGCTSYVGRIGGVQDLNLQAPGCVTLLGTSMHEFMHALGFVHEQSRPERDDFLTINLDNVQAGMEHNFAKYTTSQVSSFNVGYDYGSLMHYSAYAFSKNGLPTMVPKRCGSSIGQAIGFSASDIASIKAMYGCLF